MVLENIEHIRSRIRDVCFRCGRNPDEVQLVAVAKTFGPEIIRQALRAGLLDIGESYVQEMTRKRQALHDENIRWHFVGHLQSNKVKYIVDFVHLIHAVDGLSVAAEIQKRAEKAVRNIDVLVEVHTTDEATKFGIEPEKALDFVKQVAHFPRVRVKGLMTMGPFSEDPEDSRPSFKTLAEIRRTIDKEGIEGVSMEHLSMGMTHDFEVALEEGGTILRIGTGIFGERKDDQADKE